MSQTMEGEKFYTHIKLNGSVENIVVIPHEAGFKVEQYGAVIAELSHYEKGWEQTAGEPLAIIKVAAIGRAIEDKYE